MTHAEKLELLAQAIYSARWNIRGRGDFPWDGVDSGTRDLYQVQAAHLIQFLRRKKLVFAEIKGNPEDQIT